MTEAAAALGWDGTPGGSFGDGVNFICGCGACEIRGQSGDFRDNSGGGHSNQCPRLSPALGGLLPGPLGASPTGSRSPRSGQAPVRSRFSLHFLLRGSSWSLVPEGSGRQGEALAASLPPWQLQASLEGVCMWGWEWGTGVGGRGGGQGEGEGQAGARGAGAGLALARCGSVCYCLANIPGETFLMSKRATQEGIGARLCLNMETGSLGPNLRKLGVKAMLKGFASAERGKGWTRRL